MSTEVPCGPHPFVPGTCPCDVAYNNWSGVLSLGTPVLVSTKVPCGPHPFVPGCMPMSCGAKQLVWSTARWYFSFGASLVQDNNKWKVLTCRLKKKESNKTGKEIKNKVGYECLCLVYYLGCIGHL